MKVTWTDRARDRLADIWVAATPAERIAFEKLIVQLECDLADAPFEVGESRTGSVRVSYDPDLSFGLKSSKTPFVFFESLGHFVLD